VIFFFVFFFYLQSLIKEGAVELVIPGNFPIGCNAGVLTNVISKKKEDYDELGCLIAYNAFAEYYNEQLKNSIETLRHKHPQAKIIYFDYYNNLKRLYQTPQQYGVWSYYFIFLFVLPCFIFVKFF